MLLALDSTGLNHLCHNRQRLGCARMQAKDYFRLCNSSNQRFSGSNCLHHLDSGNALCQFMLVICLTRSLKTT